ncbi:DUF4292 domain-containing protein [Chitinophaga lutea]
MKQKGVLQIVACLVCLVLFSCRATKITRATFPSDTTGNNIVKDTVDIEKQRALSREIVEKIRGNRIEFKTMAAEMKMDYDDDKGKRMNNLTVNVRMQYDSVIWLRVSGMAGIEGARILVTRDSVKVLNKLEGTITLRNTEQAKDMLKMDLNLTALQDLIAGNAVFLPDSITGVVRTPSVISFAALQKDLVCLFNVFADDYEVQQVKVADRDSTAANPRVMELTYGDRRTVDGRRMAFQRKIYVEEKSVVKVSLDFRKVEFDKPLTFPFTVPDKYTRQ